MRKLARALRSGGRGVGMIEYLVAAMVLTAVVATGMAFIGAKARQGASNLGGDIGGFKVSAGTTTNGGFTVNTGTTTTNGINLQ